MAVDVAMTADLGEGPAWSVRILPRLCTQRASAAQASCWPHSGRSRSLRHGTGDGCDDNGGWSSCWGSPRSTSERAAGDTATVFARLITPSPDDVEGPIGESGGDPPAIPLPQVPRVRARRRLVPAGFLADRDRGPGQTGVPRGAVDLVEDVADHLVAVPRDPDRLAGRGQREDHAGPGVRLAGPGWTLDREGRAVEVKDEPGRGLEGRLVVGTQRGSRQAAGDSRGAPKEQLPCGPVDGS